MMQSPMSYIESLEGADYETLIEEREKLVDYIEEFEAREKAGDRTSRDWMMRPGPNVVYQSYLQYLSALSMLMYERYNEEYINGDKTLSATGEYKYSNEP